MKAKRLTCTWVALITLLALLSACSVHKAGGGSDNGAAASTGGKTDSAAGAGNTAANSNDAGGSDSAGAQQKVVFVNGDWPKPTDAALKQSEAWKKQFQDKFPNVEMKTEVFEYDTNTFLPKAESGQLPNLFSTWFTEPQKIINAGYAADLTDVLTANGYDQALNPDMLKIMQKDGKTYGIPNSGYYMGIWYNMSLLKKAGLLNENGVPSFPQTYDELAQMAKTIKDKTGKPGFFFPTKNNQGGWQFMNIAWSYGAEFEQQADGKWKAVFNGPEAVQALQYVKDLRWKYDVLTSNVLVDVNDLFRLMGTDQVGMSFGTTDWRNAPINDYKMSKDNLAMSKLPSGPAGRFSLTGGGLYMFAPNSTPQQIEAGLNWLKIKGFSPDAKPDTLKAIEDGLVSDAGLGRIVGPRPTAVWVNPERLQAEDAVYQKHTNVKMELWNDYLKNEGVTIKPEVPVNAQELYKSLDAVIQAVLTDKNADPKKLLDKAAVDFQRDYLDKAN